MQVNIPFCLKKGRGGGGGTAGAFNRNNTVCFYNPSKYDHFSVGELLENESP